VENDPAAPAGATARRYDRRSQLGNVMVLRMRDKLLPACAETSPTAATEPNSRPPAAVGDYERDDWAIPSHVGSELPADQRQLQPSAELVAAYEWSALERGRPGCAQSFERKAYSPRFDPARTPLQSPRAQSRRAEAPKGRSGRSAPRNPCGGQASLAVKNSANHVVGATSCGA